MLQGFKSKESGKHISKSKYILTVYNNSNNVPGLFENIFHTQKLQKRGYLNGQ